MTHDNFTLEPAMTKAEKYETLLKQAESLLVDETNTLANMSNVCALLHHGLGFWWTGFYLMDGDELVLGPFQGPVACTRIGYGKGVCGHAWKEQLSVVVPNVHEFEGHIACSSESNSEIVLPITKDGEIIGVFDVDSKEFNTFDETDVIYLQKILSLISE